MRKNAVVSRSWWRTVKRVLFYLFIFQFVYILALRWINPPITITQLSNWVNGNGMRRDYVSAAKISPYMRLAVISDYLSGDSYYFLILLGIFPYLA